MRTREVAVVARPVRRVRRLVTVAVALGLTMGLGAATPPATAAARGDGLVVELRPARVAQDVVFKFSFSARPGLVVIAVRRGAVVEWARLMVVTADGRTWPEVYGAPVPGPACPDPRVCVVASVDVTTGGFLVTVGGDGDRVRVVDVAAYNGRIELVKAPFGSRDRRVRGVLDVVRGGRTTATGVSGGGAAGRNATTVEAFTSASAPGGRRGSVAFGRLPCDTVAVPSNNPGGHAAVTGTGRAVLSGGTPGPAELVCEPYRQSGYAVQAGRATRWELAGEATGVTVSTYRLAVLSFG